MKVYNQLKKSICTLLPATIMVLISCVDGDTEHTLTNGQIPPVFNPNMTYGSMTDLDGNVYKTVTIGTQTWMAENLRTTKYSDGTVIPNITDNSEWEALTTGAYCNYNNTTSTNTITTYGRLYNWYALNTGKLAPEGWHVPTDTEWITLINYIGGWDIAGGKLKETGTHHWQGPNDGATNESGFTALPGGRRVDYGSDMIRYDGHWWWSTTDNSANSGWYLSLYWSENAVSSTYCDLNYCDPWYLGLSVRCVKD